MAVQLQKVLYTAEAVVQGGRQGHGRTTDGRLEVDLSVPEEMSGPGGPGTNPEELFAVGYAACFQSALLGVARGHNLDASESQITSRVGIGRSVMHAAAAITVDDVPRPAIIHPREVRRDDATRRAGQEAQEQQRSAPEGSKHAAKRAHRLTNTARAEKFTR